MASIDLDLGSLPRGRSQLELWMHAADGFHGREHGLLEVDDGLRLPMFTFALRGRMGGSSCINRSAAKMSQAREILELKESEVLY